MMLLLACLGTEAKPVKSGSSRRCKARVAILSMEWLGPVFSGNGIYARTLADKLIGRGSCVAVVSALPDTSPSALASQIKSDPVVAKFAGVLGCGLGSTSRSICRSKDGNMVIGVTVNASKWRRLGLDGVWEEYAEGLNHASDAFRALAAFRPHVLLAVDWHGSLAAEAFHQSWESVCARVQGSQLDGTFDWSSHAATAFREFATKRCDKGGVETPTVFFNFRLFSGSSTLTKKLTDLFMFVALEGRASNRADRVLALSMVDTVRLVRLSSITGDGLVPMPWAGGKQSWWSDLRAWARAAVASTNGKDLTPLLRHAMGVDTATRPHAASSLVETGEADGFGVLLPSLRDSIRARALLDPASYVASTQDGGRHPEGDPSLAEDAMGLYSGDSAQHDQLPWVEMFHQWLLDDSSRAQQDDVDAWLASHAAAFEMNNSTEVAQSAEMALVVADSSLPGAFTGDEDGESPLPFETLHNDSLVIATPTVRKRPHRFIRPQLLRFPIELHPIHPSLSEQAQEARGRKRRAEEEQLNQLAKPFDCIYDPVAGFRDKEGAVVSDEMAEMILATGEKLPDHLQRGGRAVMDLEKDGWEKIVAQLYNRADGDYARLLPPRWLADAGFPIDEAVPDKMLVTVRSVRAGYEALMQEEMDGARGLPEHILRAADAEEDEDRRSRVLAAARAASALQRPRESVMVPTRRLVLWCSRMSPEKQPLLFAKALHIMGSLLQETPLLPAVCIDGPNEKLNSKMEELVLMAHPHAVILSGFLGPGRMAEIFARTALYVHTADYEAYGMTPVEAAAFGTPTLAHQPDCSPGSVCVSSVAGRRAGGFNASDPTESLDECSKRLTSYRRGETTVLMRLYEREQEAAQLAEETVSNDPEVSRRLELRADRVAEEHNRVLEARKSHPLPRVEGSPPMAQAKGVLPAVGSLELLRPSLGRAYGTDMTAEPWQLAMAMGRVLCRLSLRSDWADAGYDQHNFLDKFVFAHDIPFRPAVSVPALATWINADYRARSRTLRLVDARTGANSQDREKMLHCRQQAMMGFLTQLEFEKHVDECACLGIGSEHRAHALPIGRGERIAAAVRGTDDADKVEQQEEDAAAGGKHPHKPIPHPGCVGLAARQAALAWTDDDSAASLMQTLVKTAKAAQRKAASNATTQSA